MVVSSMYRRLATSENGPGLRGRVGDFRKLLVEGFELGQHLCQGRRPRHQLKDQAVIIAIDGHLIRVQFEFPWDAQRLVPPVAEKARVAGGRRCFGRSTHRPSLCSMRDAVDTGELQRLPACWPTPRSACRRRCAGRDGRFGLVRLSARAEQMQGRLAADIQMRVSISARHGSLPGKCVETENQDSAAT